MEAVVIDRFGPPDVLSLRQIETPSPGSGQVRVQVHAAGVNPVDAWNRADGSWAGLEPPVILGSDFSGVVDAVGEGVTGWSAGDQVFGLSPFRGSSAGTYAEYHLADARSLLRKPEGLSHLEAAAIPLAAATALEVIERRLAVQAGELVLIHGAGGGVGSFAVQIAAAAGASVIASASERHHELLGRLGADLCLDYRRVDVATAALERSGRELDAVADFVGGHAVARSLSALREGGRAASVVAFEGDLEPAIDRNITLYGVLLDAEDHDLLEQVRERAAAGELRPVVSEVYPLAEAARAHRRLEEGHVQGKLVLRVR
jgi:NADPH2:quinone reductase